MSLLNDVEVKSIGDRLGLTKISKWRIKDFKEIIGYLGDHLELTIEGEFKGGSKEFHLFVKCLPRSDQTKLDFLHESLFFQTEYLMLSNLFENFQNGEGSDKWRPKTLFTRKDLFVFENVNKLGYKMPHFENTMTYEALKAAVKTVARFHAQSYIYEERKSKIIGMPFRIWSEFNEYLQEPDVSRVWRDIGRDGVIDYLKTFSKYKSNPGFDENIDEILPGLYEKAMDLMKPSNKYRNVVIHRDLWCNNIFIKNDRVSEPHALLVDFQTVVYSSPMLDLSSLIYMNTAKTCRDTYTQALIDVYYETLSRILEEAGLEIDTILPKDILRDAYNDSLIFGITQASLIVPYTSFSPKWKTIIFTDPVRNKKFNYISRSEDYIEIANDDPVYKHRVSELLDELVDHFVYPHKK